MLVEVAEIINIGIFDAEQNVIAKLLSTLIQYHNFPVKLLDEIFPGQSLDILIINKPPGNQALLQTLSPKIIIANSDDKQILDSASYIGGRIITYGFNPKAALTASSLLDNTMIICVQRAITTISNDPIFPQEFSAQAGVYSDSALCTMAYIATALVLGLPFHDKIT